MSATHETTGMTGGIAIRSQKIYGDLRGKMLSKFRQQPDCAFDAVLHGYGPTTYDLYKVALEAARTAILAGRVVDAGVIEKRYNPLKKMYDSCNQLAEHSLLSRPFSEPWIVIGTDRIDEITDDGQTIECEHTVGAVMGLDSNGNDVAFTFCWMERTDSEGEHPPILSIDRIAIIDWDGFQFSVYPVPDDYGCTYEGFNRIITYTMAVMNTRGVSWTVRPTKTSRKGRIQNIGVIKPRTDYFTALKNKPRNRTAHQGGTHASPIPHIRRGHLRTYADGRQTWVRDCVVNVASEGELSFLERRGYKL